MSLSYGYSEEYLQLAGGKLTGNINMSLYRVTNIAAPIDNTNGISKIYMSTYINSFIDKILIETLVQEYNRSAAVIYKFDRGNSSEVSVADSSTRQVSRIFDQSLSADDAKMSNTASQPLLCAKAERVNNRYFLKFDGNKRLTSYINLNPKPSEYGICNVFIVYHLKAFDANTYWHRNGLFGNDNGGCGKFVSFVPPPNKDLIISYGGNYATIGPTVHDRSIGTYKNKANPSEINKWICLSIHWNQSAGTNGSFVYCNGQKLSSFTTITTQGSSRMIICDINLTGVAPLKGDKAMFILYRHKMEESDILLHHKCICEKWFNIDHKPINL